MEILKAQWMMVEPPEQVRQWVREVVGLAPPGDRPEGPLPAWAVLGPALAAVHGASIPVETEPATLLVIPGP